MNCNALKSGKSVVFRSIISALINKLDTAMKETAKMLFYSFKTQGKNTCSTDTLLTTVSLSNLSVHTPWWDHGRRNGVLSTEDPEIC